ncbi:hypothetical protein ABZS66_00045 [Dactylosporangium sp. NPDC005572]|uniref:hypothetical protein n=1 Tax=Dactylosporangium sp. NPDC005572 TaxID=3156889 RepID=UPI0033B2F069
MNYLGDSQFVALYQNRSAGVVNDGVITEDADAYGWRLFRGHALVRQLLRGYHLGTDQELAQHWLVVDQLTGRLTATLPDDANALLASQPRTREALIGDMSPHDATRYLEVLAEVTEASSDSWMDYARALRIAQRTMLHDLDVELGERLLRQIRGLGTSISDATRRPERGQPADRPRWSDLDLKPSADWAPGLGRTGMPHSQPSEMPPEAMPPPEPDAEPGPDPDLT